MPPPSCFHLIVVPPWLGHAWATVKPSQDSRMATTIPQINAVPRFGLLEVPLGDNIGTILDHLCHTIAVSFETSSFHRFALLDPDLYGRAIVGNASRFDLRD